MMSEKPKTVKKPPWIINQFLIWYINRELLEEIEGDLNEEYNDRCKGRGRWMANFLYVLEVIRFMRMYNSERKYQTTNHLGMLENHIKTAFRNLRKYKLYSTINIGGLAIGMSCAFIIFLFIRVETSYDKFHSNGNNIYRMQHVYGFIGAPVGREYTNGYSEIKDFTRVNPWYTESRFSVSDRSYFDDLLFADPNFFSFFSFPLIKGNAETCLSSNDKIVISERVARKYFGDEDPIGKMIKAPALFGNKDLLFKVSAVVKDIPFNSHLQFDMVTNFSLLMKNPSVAPILEKWENDWIGTYVLMDPDVDTQRITDDFENFSKNFEGAENGGPYNFMPLEDLYLESYYLNFDYADHGNGNQVKIFMAIAILILLIGCINFTNLATARAAKRSKEVGVRKTLGAFRSNLIMQFFAESAIMTLIALVATLVILIISIPAVEQLGNIDLAPGLKDHRYIAFLTIGVTLSTILLSGSYPAIFLSSFQPASILKEHKNNGRSTAWIRKGLVIFQFAISTMLIIGSLVIYDQMQFVRDKELGFNPANTVRFDFGSRNALHQKWPMIKAELSQQPGVQAAFTTEMVPGDNAYYWGYKFEGYTEEIYGDGWLGYYIGPDLIGELDIEVILGRSFSSDIPSDSNAFVLNESAWQRAISHYGDHWKDPIGKRIEYYTTNSGDWALDKSGPVIGVVEDFHHHSLKQPIEPIVIHNFKGSNIILKSDPDKTMSLINYVQDHWDEWGSTAPFEYKYVSSRFNEHYESEERFADFMIIFCALAIIIACMGLYGLASYTAQLRIKEIGIRKVLGASIQQIMKMLSVEFLRLISIAIILSIPVIVYTMNEWLANFSYRISLQWYHILSGAIVATVIALLTISSNAIKAATSNPVNSLRSE